MVDHAQAAKLPVQKMADRISAVFVPSVMALATVTFLGWLAAGARFATALSHAMAVLLIACPCSLGLATPTAIMVATGRAARQGIYIRNGEALETAGRLEAIVFDKTGTITEGRPRVTDLINGAELDDATLLALAAAAEGRSEHFLARAIRARAEVLSVPRWAATDFEVFPGRGIRARVEGHEVLLGNGAMLAGHGIDAAALERQAATLAETGETPVLMAVDGEPVAVIGIADGPRTGAPAAIARLRRLGIAPIMVTGDTAATARTVAALVGIRAVVAQAAPERKLAIVRALQTTDRMHVGMVGDGINDAPALAAADVSFAVGTGTDVAMDTADMTLVSGDIAQVVEAVVLSRRTMRIIRQNLIWALGYNTIAIPLAAMGRLSPMIASAAMALSSVSVVTNSLRLNR
jgi:Cu+-exporting ATPase